MRDGDRRTIDRTEEWAWRVWLTYHVCTERFDRIMPGGWSPYDKDVWLPFPGSPREESTQFAQHQRRRAMVRLDGIVDTGDVRHRVEQLSFQRQVDMLAAMGGEIVDPLPSINSSTLDGLFR